MNHEQSIDDILRLLKESYGEDSAIEDESEKEFADRSDSEDFSHDDLQAELKRRFCQEPEEDRPPWESEEDEETASNLEEEIILEEEEEPLEEKIILEEEEAPLEEEIVLEEEDEPLEEESILEEEKAPLEEEVVLEEEKTILEEELALEEEEEETLLEEEDVTDEEDFVFGDEIIYEENSLTEEALTEDEVIADEDAPVQEPMAEEEDEVLFRDLQDYEVAESLVVDATPNVEMDTAIEIDEPLIPDTEEIEPMDEELQPAVMELLLQLGCEEEWEELERRDEKASSEAEEPEEAVWERNALWLSAWKRLQHRCVSDIVRVVGLAVMTVLLFLYDGISDGIFKGVNGFYRSYPLAYVMFGTQLLLISALWMLPKLWQGIRDLFKLRIHLYSTAALVFLFVLLYDAITVLAKLSVLPAQLHFVATLVMLLAQISALWETRRSMAYWNVYRPEASDNRFTLISDPEGDPVVATMLRGGLSYDKRVYSPRIIEPRFSPKDRSIPERENHRLFAWMTVPTVLIGILSVLLSILLKQKLQTALVSGMLALCLMLPVSAMFIPWIVTAISVKKLKKRQIYFRDDGAIGELGTADYLIFNDLHLFSKAKASDVKMVAYEQNQVGDLLGCLDCLYSTVGGPLSDVFSALPAEFKKNAVRIRRIKRNGMEAIVDRQHVLLVGDAAFMRQYGLNFEDQEAKKGRGTLCVSLDGKRTAKLMVQYHMEPVFEMLVERLHKEKVQCVIETFDPLIQAKFVASARVWGQAPISVVHKGCSELKERGYSHRPAQREQNPGVVVCASRLKLAEAMIWCKRIRRIKKKCAGIGMAMSIIGCGLSMLLLFLGIMADATQYWVILSVLLSSAVLFLSVCWDIPRKRELTVEQFEEENFRIQQRQQEKK